jgi:hypothetical protein
MNRNLLAGAAASLVAFAIFHNVVFNAGGVLEHFRLLSTLGDLAIVPRTAAGYADMTTLSVRLFRFALGWPFAILALAGLFEAVRRPERRWWLWFLLVPVSFHVAFTWVTLYVNDRYLFPGLFVMALFAGAAIADLVESRRGRGLARGMAIAAVGYSLLHAASVNVMMDLDARDDATAWLAREAPAGARIVLVGSYEPAVFPPLRAIRPRASVDAVLGAGAEFVVLNWRFAQRYLDTRSPDGRDLLAALEDGSLGYLEVYRHRGQLPAWAVLQYDPEFSRARESTWTNLDKINPEVRIYRRLPDAPREAGDEGGQLARDREARLALAPGELMRRHLDDAQPAPERQQHHLEFDRVPVLPERQLSDGGRANRAESVLGVGQRRAVSRVDDLGQEVVAPQPDEHGPASGELVAAAAHAAADDHVRLVGLNGRHQRVDVGRVVGAVRVHRDDHLAGRGLEPEAQRVALAAAAIGDHDDASRPQPLR